jgi:hypothetical protein
MFVVLESKTTIVGFYNWTVSRQGTQRNWVFLYVLRYIKWESD